MTIQVIDPRLTLLCVHGNPTWSFVWRRLIAGAPPDVRVVAVDQLDMGFSDRTGTVRRLAQRIEDLSALTETLAIEGPVVTVAHDWGGPISLGWAQRHRRQLAGIVLMNTAVHQPPTAAAPRLIRVARSPILRNQACVTTPVFVRGTVALAKPRLAKPIRDAYLAPYRTKERRAAIGTFVEDIPLEPDHPSFGTLEQIADGLEGLGEVPTLLVWGTADPVFSDLYLRDLEQRMPHADVHRFTGAGHLVMEDADVAGTIVRWVGRGGKDDRGEDEERPDRDPLWRGIEARADDDAVAVKETIHGGPTWSLSFAELNERVHRLAAGLAAHGLEHGDRVALMVPPGLNLTVVLYACWRAGAVVVVADAGLGVRGLTRAVQSANPAYVIGIPKALAAARVMRWPGERISVVPLGPSRHRVLGAAITIEDLERLGTGRETPQPPSADDLGAVAFTSGSTGPAKGVVYRHHQLQAQRDLLMQVYGIGPGDRLVAAFAPFALYGPAMGIPSMVPDMDVTAPGSLRAAALADAVVALEATLVFASPAALVSVLRTSDELTPVHRAALERVRVVMSAGAPVHPDILRRTGELMPNAELHTPYGMTEVLPVADITLEGIEDAGDRSGVCVGVPVQGVRVAVSPIDGSGTAGGDLMTEPEVVGEICISAPHVKESYDKLWATQEASAQPAGWHRSGDVGHLDREGRLWIEGRMAHLIRSADGPVTPVGIEHAVERLDDVDLAAAVGVGPVGTQRLVVVVKRSQPDRRPGLADQDLTDRVRSVVATDVAAVLEVPELPVDKRHNSKIERTRIAAWAERVLAGERVGKP